MLNCSPGVRSTQGSPGFQFSGGTLTALGKHGRIPTSLAQTSLEPQAHTGGHGMVVQPQAQQRGSLLARGHSAPTLPSNEPNMSLKNYHPNSCSSQGLPSAPTQPSVPLQDPNVASEPSDLTVCTPAQPPTSYSPHHPPRNPGSLGGSTKDTLALLQTLLSKGGAKAPASNASRGGAERGPGPGSRQVLVTEAGSSPGAARHTCLHPLAPCWNTTSTKNQQYVALWLPFLGPPLQPQLCRHQATETRPPGAARRGWPPPSTLRARYGCPRELP